MRKAWWLVLGMAAAGCGNVTGLERSGANPDGDSPGSSGNCAKIEGSQIGVENLTLEVGSELLTFHSWIPKSGQAGEYIGFSYSQTGPLSIRVKAGPETYEAEGGAWAHPEAATHASASAVSNVEGCDPDDPGNDDPGDGGDDPDDDDDDDPGDDGDDTDDPDDSNTENGDPDD